MLYIIDSYAWIEYFKGSAEGNVLQRLFLDPENRFLTVECCLAEIKGWSIKHKTDFDQLFKIVRADSRIIPVTEHDWIEAAQHRFQQRQTQPDFGLIDAVLLVKQQEFNCKIISGDKHFKNLNEVVFLK